MQISNDIPLDMADSFVAVDKNLYDLVDVLVRKARKIGANSTIETEQQWGLVRDIIRVWEIVFEEDAKEFYGYIKGLKGSQVNKYGSKREAGGAEVRHLGEMPSKVRSLILAVFPNAGEQMFEKKFMRTFVRKFPQFKVADKI